MRDLLGAFRREYTEDDLGDIAAMLTYYAIFALFPMAVFVMTLALILVPESTLVQGTEMLTRTMPQQAATFMREHVLTLKSTAGGGIAVGAALLALWGASRGALALGRGLNKVFRREETRPWWRKQVTAVLVTLVVAVLMIVALGLLAAGPAVGRLIADRVGLGEAFTAAWTLGRWVVAALLVMFTWAVLYRYLPDHRRPLRPFSAGTVLGVLVWVGASLLFALYVSNFGKYEKTYGAFGAVVIFLVWLWISNLALLVGALVNHVVDARRSGRRREAADRPVGVQGGAPA
jgi:membrane protein